MLSDNAPTEELREAHVGMDNKIPTLFELTNKPYVSSDVRNLKQSHRKAKGKPDPVDNVRAIAETHANDDGSYLFTTNERMRNEQD